MNKVITGVVGQAHRGLSRNARRAGYLVAVQAFFHVSSVSEVIYNDRHGRQRTLSAAELRRLRADYRLGRGLR